MQLLEELGPSAELLAVEHPLKPARPLEIRRPCYCRRKVIDYGIDPPILHLQCETTWFGKLIGK
jgi:hypothetical protein